MNNRAVFGGVIASVLLALYVYSVWYATAAAVCLGRGACATYSPELTQGVSTIMTLVGGLVSALAIAALAVSDPGELPSGRLLVSGASAQQRSAQIVTTLYLAAWLICGVVSVIVGLMRYPDAVPVLTAASKAWLGLAVGAAYAYFGLKPGAGSARR